jgi:hypothetical protein
VHSSNSGIKDRCLIVTEVSTKEGSRRCFLPGFDGFDECFDRNGGVDRSDGVGASAFLEERLDLPAKWNATDEMCDAVALNDCVGFVGEARESKHIEEFSVSEWGFRRLAEPFPVVPEELHIDFVAIQKSFVFDGFFVYFRSIDPSGEQNRATTFGSFTPNGTNSLIKPLPCLGVTDAWIARNDFRIFLIFISW